MRRYFQDRYALSDEGVRDFICSVIWSALLNISLMFPAMLAFYFIRQAVLTLDTGEALEHGALFYLVLAGMLASIMFCIALKQYDSAYTKIYEESARMRISLAEKIRKLPLAFFGRRDIADLSATIMEDATEIEHMFSHAVPQLYASYISIGLVTLALTLFHWQMALAMFWVVPVALLVFYLSKNYQKRTMVDLRNAKLQISDTLQEGLDCIGEIKAYNYEKKYSDQLAALLDGYETKLIRLELIAGALINFSFILLKLGLVSVALIGAWLFVQGRVDLFTYIVFLIVSAGIYEPFNTVIANMAGLSFLEARIARKKEMDAMPIQQGRTECA
ncbi:MAG: ABC transporter ATP-binding protein, partial [Spirochaetales bacterium]